MRKRFLQDRNPSPPCGMKNSFKNTFPLEENCLSLAGVSKKWKKLTPTKQKISFSDQEKGFSLKIYHHQISNKALNKRILFPLDRKFRWNIRFHLKEKHF